MFKLLLTAAFMGCLLPGVLSICEPDCSDQVDFARVEDPMDCTKYYICMPGGIPTDSSLPCDPGNIFDPLLGVCSPGSLCKASCVLPNCHLTCDQKLDLISDPFDCSVYYVCLGGVVGETIRCPTQTPYFDGKYCVDNKAKCCSELCTPYCYENVIQAPDPVNCKAFYICEEEGKPSEDHHFYCKDKEVFDISLGQCTEDAQCKPLCDPGITLPPDGSTPPHTSTTTSTPKPGGCLESLICTTSGYFAQCSTCEPGFFDCNGPGQQGILHTCPDGKVFNTNPDVTICISAENCPFYP